MVSLNSCGCIWCQNLTTSDICAYLLISQSLTDSDSHKSDQTEIWTLKAAQGTDECRKMRYFLLSAEKNYQSLIWRMHRGADEILQKEFHAAFQSRASECKADFWLFLFFRYLPMMGLKVNLFWPITLVEKSVAYNNILQTGFKLVLTVRILQTLGFQPCYVFILDSLQAQWITVYGRRILNKMLQVQTCKFFL